MPTAASSRGGIGAALGRRARISLMCLALAVAAGCAHGPYVEPEDFSASLSDEQVAENFLKVAFGQEYGADPLLAGRLLKWRGPVRFVFLDAVSARQRELVETHIARLSEITGLTFTETRSRRHTDLAIRISSIQQIVDDLRGFSQNPRLGPSGVQTLRELEARLVKYERAGRFSEQCAFLIGGSHPRWSGYVAIREGMSDGDFWSCVVEELTQVFGLRNDHPDVRPSIFNDDGRYLNLTRHDVWLLQLLYDPAVKSGMTRQEVKEIVEERIAFYRSQTEVRLQ